MNWIDEETSKLHRFYSDVQGSTNERIRTSLTEAKAQGAQEALAKVEEWVKAHSYETQDGGYILTILTDDLLHYLQQLKDKKGV